MNWIPHLRMEQRSGVGLGLGRLLTCLRPSEAWVGRVRGWRVGDPTVRRRAGDWDCSGLGGLVGDLPRPVVVSAFIACWWSSLRVSCSSRIGSTSALRDSLPALNIHQTIGLLIDLHLHLPSPVSSIAEKNVKRETREYISDLHSQNTSRPNWPGHVLLTIIFVISLTIFLTFKGGLGCKVYY